jgi:hypothetical protein
VAGRGGGRPPYPVVVRLHAIADDEWAAIDGQCAAQGVDPLALSPDRFCNLIYAWALSRVEDRAKFDALLSAPLPGRERTARVSPETQVAETRDLMSMAQWAAAVQGG